VLTGNSSAIGKTLCAHPEVVWSGFTDAGRQRVWISRHPTKVRVMKIDESALMLRKADAKVRPKLARFVDAMMAVPGVAESVNLVHIKRGYYSIKALNPTLIVPLGPDPRLLPGLRVENDFSREPTSTDGR
jgi:hypothetical protein